MTRRGPISGRVSDPQVDRLLRNLDERVRELAGDSPAKRIRVRYAGLELQPASSAGTWTRTQAWYRNGTELNAFLPLRDGPGLRLRFVSALVLPTAPGSIVMTVRREPADGVAGVADISPARASVGTDNQLMTIDEIGSELGADDYSTHQVLFTFGAATQHVYHVQALWEVL